LRAKSIRTGSRHATDRVRAFSNVRIISAVRSFFARVHDRHRARVAVSGHRLHVVRARARHADAGRNVVDGRVHRRRQLRHGRAGGTADGPDRTQVDGALVRAADVRRVEDRTVRPPGKAARRRHYSARTCKMDK